MGREVLGMGGSAGAQLLTWLDPWLATWHWTRQLTAVSWGFILWNMEYLVLSQGLWTSCLSQWECHWPVLFQWAGHCAFLHSPLVAGGDEIWGWETSLMLACLVIHDDMQRLLILEPENDVTVKGCLSLSSQTHWIPSFSTWKSTLRCHSCLNNHVVGVEIGIC